MPPFLILYIYYRKVSNIRRTFVCNKIVDHSDVVGASSVGAAPTTSSFATQHLASLDWAKTTARRDEKRETFKFGDLVRLILDIYGTSLLGFWWPHENSDFRLPRVRGLVCVASNDAHNIVQVSTGSTFLLIKWILFFVIVKVSLI